MVVAVLVFMITSISMLWQTFGAVAGIITTALWVLFFAWCFSWGKRQEEEKQREQERIRREESNRDHDYRVGNNYYHGLKLRPGQPYHRFDGDRCVNCEIVEALDDVSAILKDPSGRRIRVSRRLSDTINGTNYYTRYLFSDSGVTYSPGWFDN